MYTYLLNHVTSKEVSSSSRTDAPSLNVCTEEEHEPVRLTDACVKHQIQYNSSNRRGVHKRHHPTEGKVSILQPKDSDFVT